MHLLMWAIHSAFSVGVAANTAKDFLGEMICHPFFQATRWEGWWVGERGMVGGRERDGGWEREGWWVGERGMVGGRERDGGWEREGWWVGERGMVGGRDRDGGWEREGRWVGEKGTVGGRGGGTFKF